MVNRVILMALTLLLAVGIGQQARGQDAAPGDSSAQTEELTVTSSESTETDKEQAQPASTVSPTKDALPAGMTGADNNAAHELRMKGLEHQVHSLKERVFRSRARLLLLRETVLEGVVSGSKAVLFHVNDLGNSYSIESLTYYLDGSKVYNRTDLTDELTMKDEIKVFEGSIPPGSHEVTTVITIRGNGHGVFTYLNDYKLQVRHSYQFISDEGKVSRLRIICYERPMLDYKDRPSLRYDLVTDRNMPGALETLEE